MKDLISSVKFDAKEHKYYAADGHELISVTTLLKKHGIGVDYSGVDSKALSAARDRGIEVHAEIHNVINMFINNGGFNVVGDNRTPCDIPNGMFESLRPETKLFLDYIKEAFRYGRNHLYTEQILHNDYLAGTTDLLFSRTINNGIGVRTFVDFKTGKNIDMNYCSWQLSMYAYLFAEFHPNLYTEAERYVLHFHEDRLDIIAVPKVPFEEIEHLLECDKAGEIYSPRVLAVTDAIPDNLIVEMESTHKKVAALEKHLEDAKETEKAVKQIIMEEMKKHKLKSVESPFLKMTYVEAYERETFDTKKFRQDHPETASKYLKKSEVKETLKLTVKELSSPELSSKELSSPELSSPELTLKERDK